MTKMLMLMHFVLLVTVGDVGGNDEDDDDDDGDTLADSSRSRL